MAEGTDLGPPPGYYREQRGLTLAQVKALGREATWQSDRGECYGYFPSEGGQPSGFWFFSFSTHKGWQPVTHKAELPESPWWHTPTCDCGECVD
jgi:hypothetical protein